MTSAARAPGEPRLTAEVSHEPGIDLVVARGELDVGTTGQLRTLLFDPESCAAPLLLLDLSGISFADSTGLGALIAARRWTTSRGARLAVVCDPDGPVTRLLELTRLDLVLDCWPSRDAATTALGAG